MPADKRIESPAAGTTGHSQKKLAKAYLGTGKSARPAIDDIKAAVPIEEYLAARGIHPARQTQTVAVYRCPLGIHEDKTPSFFIDRVKQLWHCFGCDQGGDVITLAEFLEGLPTGEAIRWLARLAGLVDRYPSVSTPRPERPLHEEIDELSEEEKEKLRAVIEEGAAAEKGRLAWEDHVKLAWEIKAAARPVELAPVLAEVEALLTRYVAFPLPEQVTAVTLWAAHTHVFEHFDISPYLAVLSPEKRSGKTRLCEVLEHLVARPWRVVQPTEAVLFRQIESIRPTVLLDEVDTIFGRGKEYEPLRALLNAGNRRGTMVPRCLEKGRTFEVQNFAVFCPKLLAGIGNLPDTVEDRAIVIRLQRKSASQAVGRFRFKTVATEADPIRDDLQTWAASFELPDVETGIPLELDDRAAEAWEPLLILADMAGGDWPQRARQAALVLSAGRAEEDPSTGVRLLADIRGLFEEKQAERLTTSELLAALHQVETSPWGEEPKLTARRLAKILRGYGIKPGHWEEARGYRKADFRDAFERYLLSPYAKPSFEPSEVSASSIHAGLSPFSKCQDDGSADTFEMPENPLSKRVLTLLTHENAILETVTHSGAQIAGTSPACPRYQWRLPEGAWRDLIAHPPPTLGYLHKSYSDGQAREALAALCELKWSPRVPPCLQLANDLGGEACSPMILSAASTVTR